MGCFLKTQLSDDFCSTNSDLLPDDYGHGILGIPTADCRHFGWHIGVESSSRSGSSHPPWAMKRFNHLNPLMIALKLKSVFKGGGSHS